MSTNLNMAAAPGAVADSGSTSSLQRAGGAVGQWLRHQADGWREAMALRRSLREISQLSERELLDIGLAQDEIVRLRSAEHFMPRSWQARPIGREELPF